MARSALPFVNLLRRQAMEHKVGKYPCDKQVLSCTMIRACPARI